MKKTLSLSCVRTAETHVWSLDVMLAPGHNLSPHFHVKAPCVGVWPSLKCFSMGRRSKTLCHWLRLQTGNGKAAQSPQLLHAQGGFTAQHVCFHTMLILSLREQSSQNQSQYDQQDQYNAYPGVPTASSCESRRKVLRFNKVNILSCLFLAPPALRGRDGDIIPASHFSWLPKQDRLVGDSSEDTSKGLEMQRCTTHPETLSTLRQREQSAEQRRQNEAESETSAPNMFPHKEMTAQD